MSEIKNVSLASLEPNPMRMTKKYPFNEDKIEALRRSIKDVGLWEGVIARRKSSAYQTAFGHHRIEAARKELGRDARIPIIVRDLTDEQMIQFMGRENLEDYNADFLVMLESWEAGTVFLSRAPGKNPQPLDVAGLLGWTRLHKGSMVLNDTAEAASAASKLVSGGYITNDRLEGLTVYAVREVCGRVLAQHEMLERMAKKTNAPAAEIERNKKVSARAGSAAAKDVRAGRIAVKDIRGAVDTHAYKHAQEQKKQSPLFAMFGRSLADQIAKICKDDMIAEKFSQIKKSLNLLTEDSDIEVVKRLALECENAAERFDAWHTTFANPKRKVVALKEIGR